MKKRVLALLMAVCMTASLCSVAAFADDDPPETTEDKITSEEGTDSADVEANEEEAGEEEVNAWFGFNGTSYWIGSDNIPHTDDDGEEGTTALPEGVAYDYGTNTLTLNGAKLTYLGFGYSGWDEENGWQWQNLPTADLAIVLEGENSVVNPAGGVNGDYHAFEFNNGVNVTIQGSGSLTVEAQDTAEDEWVGRAVSISGHSSLTITDSAKVVAKVTGESCNVNEDDSWTDFIAVDGDWNTDNELTVSGNATLEAYGDCAGIRSIDITAKDNATIKTNMISLYINTPEQAAANEDDADIEEGLAPRVMTVEDNAVVDIKSSYETEIEGCYEALALNYGSKLLVKGGTVNVTQDSGVTEWDSGDTGIGVWFDEELYDLEKDTDMRSAIEVTGGELNVTSCFVGIQMNAGDLTVSGGTVNVASTTSQFGIYAYNGSAINLSGGSLNVETVEKEDDLGLAISMYESDLTITGGTHRFGSKDLSSMAGLEVYGAVNITGGTTEIYGSICAMEFGAFQDFFEDVDNLDRDNLPIDEEQLACPFTIGGDLIVTDAATGAELTLGKLDHVYSTYKNYEGEDIFVGYTNVRYYSFTEDGSTEIKPGEGDNWGMWQNCAKAVSISAYTNPFEDVEPDTYYTDAVAWAVRAGITTGTTPTTFSPEKSCTRAEMAKFLWNLAGSPAPTATENPFEDVSADDWFYDAVLWCVEKGIVGGTTPTTFEPNMIVDRGQTVTFLYRYAGSPAVTGSNSFIDVAEDAYYANAVQWGVKNGLVYGTNSEGTVFSPNNVCTRGQIVTLLYRYSV